MKNLLFLLILNITFLKAQTYDFNYLISYSITSLPNCKAETSMYVNTKNDHYYLLLIRKQDNSLISKVMDYESDNVHYFTVNETKKNNEVFFEFQYDYSINLKNSMWFHKSKSVFFITNSSAYREDGDKNLELQVYKNSKKKKRKSIFSLDVKKSENFFPAFKYCYIHPHEFKNEQNPENILVTKAKETTEKGQLINYELKTLKEVNFQLVVPKEPKN